MPHSLTLALALSLAVHGTLLLPDLLKRFAAAPSRPALQATLRLPPKPENAPVEQLLKNTLDTSENQRPADVEARKPQPGLRSANRREVQSAQRKIASHLYYPPEAIARGLEGEVRLILKLAADGSVDDIHLAASSGHPILDNAAVKAAYAMGALTGVTSRELILPVIFRLQ